MGAKWKRDPYEPTVYGIGFHGEGEYKPSYKGVHTPASRVWKNMLRRCYCEKYYSSKKTYEGATVCEEWHNYQNFAKWYEENCYQIDGDEIHLDKDILVKGNKVYSPETCVFVPEPINSLFTKRQGRRGDLPIGVHLCPKGKKYIAQCGSNGRRVYLGRYDTPEEAFQRYKEFKEQEVKRVAEHYKDLIPQKLYEALQNYEVDYDD